MSQIDGPPLASEPDSTEVELLIEAFNGDASSPPPSRIFDRQKLFWQRRMAVLRRTADHVAGLESDLEATRRDLEATRRDLEMTRSELAEQRLQLAATRHAEYLQSEAAQRAEDELRGYRQHAANLEELLKSLQVSHDRVARNLAETTKSRVWRLTQFCSRSVRRATSIFRGTPRAAP